MGWRDLNIKLLDNAILRYTKAYTLSGSLQKKEMQKDLEMSIKRAKKMKFFIERDLYNKEANLKY